MAQVTFKNGTATLTTVAPSGMTAEYRFTSIPALVNYLRSLNIMVSLSNITVQ